MKKLKSLIRAPEFQVLVCLLAIFLFVWPMLITENGSNSNFLIYSLYASWAIIILIHYIMYKIDRDKD